MTPTDVPSPVKMARLPPRPLRGDAVAPEGRVGAVGGRRHARETDTGPRPPGRGAQVSEGDVERKKELAKLQAQLKRAEAKNKELQVRYGNRPAARRWTDGTRLYVLLRG